LQQRNTSFFSRVCALTRLARSRSQKRSDRTGCLGSPRSCASCAKNSTDWRSAAPSSCPPRPPSLPFHPPPPRHPRLPPLRSPRVPGRRRRHPGLRLSPPSTTISPRPPPQPPPLLIPRLPPRPLRRRSTDLNRRRDLRSTRAPRYTRRHLP
jgi:hypothetical protein